MNWLKLLNKIICTFLLLFLANSKAQNLLSEYKKQYQDFNELVLKDYQLYDIFLQNDKVVVKEKNEYESIILTENGIQNNKESFYYSDLIKLKDYEAYTINTENGKDKKIKVTQTNEVYNKQSSVFFDDVKKMQLIFPNLEPGSRKIYNYETELLDPHLLHKYVFGGALPIKNATLEINLDKNISIGFKIFNDINNSISFTKTEKKGKWNYKWTKTDVTPIKFESNSPGYLYIMPHIDVYIKEYSVKDKKVDVLGDIDKLYLYYQQFVKNLNKTDDVNLKEISLRITKDNTTDDEKIKTIFYWVKDNIKYIAFENGYEGFIPREASLIFERKFGDCKDMASIITDMARYAGVKNVFIAWIGTREIPYSYNEFATPAVDNHMIAVYKKGGNYIFLDATDKLTPYGLPSSFIQGKEALVGEEDNYKIIQVPIVAASTNSTKESVKFAIEKNKIVGSGKIEYQGYARSQTLSLIGDATHKNKTDIIKNLVLKGNNKFNLVSYEEENITDRDKPYQINYKFDLENFLLTVNEKMYINLFLEKPLEKLIIEKNRVNKFDLDFLSGLDSQYELEIPQNYKVEYLPKNMKLDNAYLKSDINYEIKVNKIILNLKIELKKLILDLSDFEQWNQTLKELKKNYTETLILTKIQ